MPQANEIDFADFACDCEKNNSYVFPCFGTKQQEMLSGPQKSMKEKTKELGNSNVLFDFYGKRPEMSQLVPLSLQHVLAAIVGVITPSMIIAGVCGLTDA